MGLDSSEASELFPWDEDSTYVRLPSFFQGIEPEPSPVEPIEDARVLVKVGDSVTTITSVLRGPSQQRPSGQVPD